MSTESVSYYQPWDLRLILPTSIDFIHIQPTQLMHLNCEASGARKRVGWKPEGPRCRRLRQGSVYDSPSPKGHGLMPVVGTEAKTILRGFFDGNDRR